MGWTRLDIIALSLCAVTSLAQLATFAVNDTGRQSPSEEQATENGDQGSEKGVSLDEINLAINRSDLDAQWLMAYGTWCVFALTIAAILVSRYYSVKELRETRRSITTQINMERARIVPIGLDLTKEPAVGVTIEGDLSVANVGRTAAEIVFGMATYDIKNTPEKQEDAKDFEFKKEHMYSLKTWILPASDLKRSDKRMFRFKMDRELTQDDIDNIDDIGGKNIFLMFAGILMYITAQGDYFELSFVFVYNAERKKMVRVRLDDEETPSSLNKLKAYNLTLDEK